MDEGAPAVVTILLVAEKRAEVESNSTLACSSLQKRLCQSLPLLSLLLVGTSSQSGLHPCRSPYVHFPPPLLPSSLSSPPHQTTHLSQSSAPPDTSTTTRRSSLTFKGPAASKRQSKKRTLDDDEPVAVKRRASSGGKGKEKAPVGARDDDEPLGAGRTEPGRAEKRAGKGGGLGEEEKGGVGHSRWRLLSESAQQQLCSEAEDQTRCVPEILLVVSFSSPPLMLIFDALAAPLWPLCLWHLRARPNTRTRSSRLSSGPTSPSMSLFSLPFLSLCPSLSSLIRMNQS